MRWIYSLMIIVFIPMIIHARNQVETEHYVVVFEQGNEYYANEVVKVAEELWDRLATSYDIFNRYQKIYIYILDPGDVANGFAIPNKNTVSIYTTNLNAGIRGTSHWIRNVVTHELAHVFSIKAASKNMLFDNVSLQTWSRFRNPDWAVQTQYWNLLAPSWWIEGMAQYEAYKNGNDFWDSHRDMFLRMAVLEDGLLNFIEMGVFGNRNGFYEEMVYNQGYSLVLYLDSAYGQAKVRQTARTPSWFTFNGTLKRTFGKSGEELYGLWKKSLREKYGSCAEKIRPHENEGSLLFDGGFWDQFPAISPADDYCAFISNKGYDVRYTHLYIMDKHYKTTRRLLSEDKTVDSRVQWFPDGNSLLYARWNTQEAYLDLYRYDCAKERETAITWHARAMDPAVSPDGRTIAYIENKGGIQNIVLIDADGKNKRQLTNFADGTQLFSPCWSPDNKSIALGIFNGADRDIAMINAKAAPFDKMRKLTDTLFFPESLNYTADLDFRLLVHSNADERDPCFSPNGKTLYYSSDRTGIFNLYGIDLESGSTEQITNVLGGAFHPSIDRDNAVLYYTGFHAANFNIYTVSAKGIKSVTVAQLERDYSKRKRVPFMFSSGVDDGVSKLKPYQYPLTPYRPTYTMWDISPFLSFSPAYITDSIGDAHLRGGMQFLFGELSGRANLMGYAYGGKALRSKAGLSWGGGMKADIRLPRIVGQNRMFQPTLALYGTKDEIRNDEQLHADPAEIFREPYQSLYMQSVSGGPDTLIAQYLDYVNGSFRSKQTFEDVGIMGGLQCNEYNRLDVALSRNAVSFSGSLIDAQVGSQIKVFTLPNPLETRESSDVTNLMYYNTFKRRNWIDTIIDENTWTLDPVSYLDEYKNFLIYQDYQTGLSWSYDNIRPAQVLPFRADLFTVRCAIASSMYTIGSVTTGNDTSFSPQGDRGPAYIYNRTVDGVPTAFMTPLLHQENYSRIELSVLERFPLFNNNRHVATLNSFFGTLDRALPDIGSVYPLQYRAGMFLSAYPYSFDPIDTGTVIDSFFVRVWTGTRYDSGYVTTRSLKADTQEGDILWGNRIMFLNASYTLEAARALTFKPFGILLQGIYLTAFAEAAALWNGNLPDFSFTEFLGMGREYDLSRIGKTYLKDAGARVEIPFVLFENWRGFLSFTWARRLSLDDKVSRIDYVNINNVLRPSRIYHLDQNRFSFTLALTN
jgi:Tol biopolymer transport system component